MSILNGNLTERIVALSARAESNPSHEYRDAAAYLAPFACRYQDSDDVASVARLILADVMASGLTGSLAAGAAVKRAAAWLSSERPANTDPMHGAVSIEDEYDRLAEMPSGDSHVAPDRIARWTSRDDLGATWDALDETGQAIMGALLKPACWNADGSPNTRAMVATLYSGATPEGFTFADLQQVMAECLTQTRQDMREVGGHLADWRHAPCTAPDRARDLARDTSTPTSGTASLMVRTLRNGSRWVTLADRSVQVDEAGVALILGNVDTLPACTDGTAGEIISAALTAPRDLLPMSRPCGVGIGMVHGNGMRAGAGAPTPRPVPSRKRKRDGGVGSPMVPAKG